MRGGFPELREGGGAVNARWVSRAAGGGMDGLYDRSCERDIYMKSSRVPFGECEVLSIGRE